MNKYIKAYTFIELLVVIGLLTVAVGLAVPYSLRQIEQNKAKNDATSIASITFNIQQDAFAGKNQSSQGIAFQSNGYYIFEGTSLATATDQQFYQLENTTISSINLTGGTNEIIFSQNSLVPSATGNIRVTDNTQSYSVVVNAQGLIYFSQV